MCYNAPDVLDVRKYSKTIFLDRRRRPISVKSYSDVSDATYVQQSRQQGSDKRETMGSLWHDWDGAHTHTMRTEYSIYVYISLLMQ